MDFKERELDFFWFRSLLLFVYRGHLAGRQYLPRLFFVGLEAGHRHPRPPRRDSGIESSFVERPRNTHLHRLFRRLPGRI